jgi:predicted O-methyltransferase YrrM
MLCQQSALFSVNRLLWRWQHNEPCAKYTSHFMSTIGDKYLLGAGRSDHERLRVISEIHDGRTRELLRRAGLVSGQDFVEFGWGLGYVTRWAASEGADATGIDLNEDHLAVATELAREAE